ncbi:aldehyde dehydrogenase family protein [Phyllobacterium sp. SB3]|uniref:aldehyde dehydrogenase family protein n=1 Tax=Phyllobacterium sp. SB3 TaxID=3156073 RepID=UPI0032AFB250
MTDKVYVARHLVAGKWIDSPDQNMIVSPFDGKAASSVAMGNAKITDAAIGSAVVAAPSVAAMPGYKRAAILNRVAVLIEERASDVGRLMARETGKAIKDAVAEVRRSQDTIILSAQEAIRIEGEHVPLDGSEMGAGKIAFMLRHPIGVVGAITPFNAPFNLSCHKLGPAFAAGNAVVLKAPPQAAGVVTMLVEMFVDAGIPAGAINLVHGGSEIGQQIVSDPRVDFITFTGSSRAGAEIKARTGLRRVALELGGSGQTIVHADADVGSAARMCARNSMRLAGQSCISVQNVFVHRDVLDDFTQEAIAEIRKLKVGDPLESETDVGTVIDVPTAMRVESWINEAIKAGARLLVGGKRHGAQLEPTVLTDVKPDMKVVCEEVFGPVMSIVPYHSFDDAVAMVNAGRYGLQCGVFTRSNVLTMQAIRTIRSGGVIINGTSTWRTDQLAYGGVKDSGIGREGPHYAIRDMTEERLVVFNM